MKSSYRSYAGGLFVFYRGWGMRIYSRGCRCSLSGSGLVTWKQRYCLNFKQADVEDIPHITHALYLLTQDGCDLLQVAQQRMLNWKAPTGA